MKNEAENNIAGIPSVILGKTIEVPTMSDSDGSTSDHGKGSCQTFSMPSLCVREKYLTIICFY